MIADCDNSFFDFLTNVNKSFELSCYNKSKLNLLQFKLVFEVKLKTFVMLSMLN